MPVIYFVTEEFKKLGKIYDEIWLLMACASLIESEDLIKEHSERAGVPANEITLISGILEHNTNGD